MEKTLIVFDYFKWKFIYRPPNPIIFELNLKQTRGSYSALEFYLKEPPYLVCPKIKKR